MELKTNKTSVNKSAADLYEFLLDVKNFEQLMPDNITKFEIIGKNAFVFALKGMPEIALEIKNSEPHSKVVLGAISDKIPFTLTCDIIEIAPDKSEAELSFEGQFNAMMAMMIKGPITKFLETLSSNLGNL